MKYKYKDDVKKVLFEEHTPFEIIIKLAEDHVKSMTKIQEEQ